MENKVPWYVTKKVPPSQVREWLEKLRNTQRPRLFTEEQWIEFLHRRRTGKLKVPDYGNSGRHCPRCGCFLKSFPICTKKEVLKRAEEDRDVWKINTGYICWACVKTYFYSRSSAHPISGQLHHQTDGADEAEDNFPALSSKL